MEVDRVSSPDSAIELARQARFDLALVDYPPQGIELPDLIQGLRNPGPSERRTYVVLVAAPDRLEEARACLASGADAVISAATPAEESTRLVHRILDAPLRVSLRVPVRLEVALEEGASLAFRQTKDLSTTGMLVRTPHALPVGAQAAFRLDAPGARSSIEGRAQVVRQILDADGRTVHAVGMRFVSFKGDDEARLQAFVDSAARSKA
jgi:CheY-like chemotaxis protein